jgi:outer membrane protein OmpA-like peptidoglycan-associated protein
MIAMNLQQKKKNDQGDIDAKLAELASRTASVNAERARLGLPPLEGIGTDSPEQIAARLTKDAASLAHFADRFRTMLSEKDRIIAEKNNSLLLSEQARQALSSQLAKVQTQLDQISANGDGIELLQNQLNDARARLEQYATRPTEEQWQQAKTRISELESQLAASPPSNPIAPAPATQQVSSAPAKLFAESRDELIPMAQGLFQGLLELEQKNNLEISAAYHRIATESKASFLKEIRFPTDSAQLNPADQIAIAEALSNLPNGAMVLVVGYAPVGGNSDANRKLSADRAKTVANNIDMAKPGNQAVQAIFLGQTNRFSPSLPERNHVCEIWQINAP